MGVDVLSLIILSYTKAHHAQMYKGCCAGDEIENVIGEI